MRFKRSLTVLVIFTLALTFFVGMPTAAHAATIPHASHATSAAKGCSKNCSQPPQGCLSATISMKVVNSNEVTISGLVINSCTVVAHRGYLTVSTAVNCPGVVFSAPTSKSAILQDPWNPNIAIPYSLGATGYCEGCTDHVPDSFPPFAMGATIEVAAQGPLQDYLYNANVPAAGANMTNSPAYILPC
jgi:hypothetical protein